ncbi:MAG: hypothetical protein H0U74_19305, partial [Bradymonadaceae bacterium]|nr:hypothetical protein [Lujinxingiaceae bacterium]
TNNANNTTTNNANNTTTNNANNATTNNANNTVEPPAHACIVNGFTTTCDDPEPKINNAWHSGVALNNNKNVGCPSGDNLITMDETYEGVMCHTEPGDWFRLGAVHCDTRTFFVEVTLTPKTECDPSLVNLKVNGYDCDHERAFCPEMEGGAKRIILRFPAPTHGVVFALYFGVEAGELEDSRLGVQFEYDLQVRAY